MELHKLPQKDVENIYGRCSLLVSLFLFCLPLTTQRYLVFIFLGTQQKVHPMFSSHDGCPTTETFANET